MTTINKKRSTLSDAEKLLEGESVEKLIKMRLQKCTTILLMVQMQSTDYVQQKIEWKW